MSYLVLARKWRPNNFDEVIGQISTTTTLKNAVKQGKLAQAYLFAGPRGIGKTSCARILAKSLNCKKGPAPSPCNSCPSCEDISKGRSFDVIEIDGASNRGIDEIRSLRENVKFSPSSGKFKIYIIDEVHMLTTEAFNALLKTLEEPPEHVKFIFATTQPDKLPSTIVSRCQRFDFRPISVIDIIKKLEIIVKHDKFKVDKEALFAIARAASGSMRDAESILDQLGAYSQNKIAVSDVSDMLGLVMQNSLFEIAESIAKKDAKNAIELADKIIGQGKDPYQFIISLMEHFRNLMIAKVGGTVLGNMLDLPSEMQERIINQSNAFTLNEILNTIDKLIEAKDLSRRIDFLRLPLELTLAKLTLSEEESSLESQKPSETLRLPVKNNFNEQVEKNPVSKPAVQNPIKAKTSLNSTKGSVGFDAQEPTEEKPAEEIKGEEKIEPQQVDLEQIKHSWHRLIKQLSTIKMSVSMFLQEGELTKIDKNILTITFPQSAKFHKESLEEMATRSMIEEHIRDIFDQDIRLDFELADKKPEEESVEDNTMVKSALDTFRGRMIGKFYK